GAAAGPRSGLGAAFQGGSDARAGNGGVRLYEEVTAVRSKAAASAAAELRHGRARPGHPRLGVSKEGRGCPAAQTSPRSLRKSRLLWPGMTVWDFAWPHRTSTFLNCQGSLVSMSSGNSPG